MAGAPGARRLSRRTLLRAAGAGGLAYATRAQAAGTARPFRTPLPIPPEITAPDIVLRAAETEARILPGRPTRLWTYNGSFPGPTIRRPAGAATTVRLEHALPAQAGELTLHHHGGHNRADDDGQPGGLTRLQPRSLYCGIARSAPAAETGNDLLVRPGASRTYAYDLTDGSQPVPGSLHWYHDHRLDHTARNVWRGLAGLWIVESDREHELGLPSGAQELPLVLADRAFNARNQLTDPFRLGGYAPNDGVVGHEVLVNGALAPQHAVEARRYRLRVLNASNFRTYVLAVDSPMIQLGADGGLLPRALPRRRVLVGPGERVDLLVDFGRLAHRDVDLRSLPDRALKSFAGPLLRFRVGAPVNEAPLGLPAVLQPLPDWVADAPRTPSHTWKVTVGRGFRPTWLINGRTFDPARADVRVPLGEPLTWRLSNGTGTPHLMHLHHADFHVLARNGAPPPPWEAGLKDTFLLRPFDEMLVCARPSDYAGKFVVHCHMLDHEDHGLMSQFETYA